LLALDIQLDVETPSRSIDAAVCRVEFLRQYAREVSTLVTKPYARALLPWSAALRYHFSALT